MNRQDAETPSGRKEPPALVDSIASQVVDAAFEVHSELGPRLLESVYETRLAHELAKRGLHVQRQKIIPIVFDGKQLGLLVNFDVPRIKDGIRRLIA